MVIICGLIVLVVRLLYDIVIMLLRMGGLDGYVVV